jgi:hypothetical protein
MSEGQFSADDLEKSVDEQRADRRSAVERGAAAVAVLAAGMWIGGMVALGACAAPMVFRLTPAPFSGEAMGSAFARFDSIALGAAVVLLGAEVLRTWAGGARGRTTTARARRALSVLMACGAVYTGLVITPAIMNLHRAGARRGQGAEGAELERIHKRAELIGKLQVVSGAAVIALHVFTLGVRRPDDDEDDAVAPLAPGPRG